jgi:membrane protease YdiL (CAAX protease family)
VRLYNPPVSDGTANPAAASLDAPDQTRSQAGPDPAPGFGNAAPAAGRVTPGARAAALAQVVLCSGFPTQILLVWVLVALGLPMRTPDGEMSPPFVFTLSLIDAALVVSLVVFFLRESREGVRAVLLGHRSVVAEGLLGVALLPAVFLLLVLVLGVLISLAPTLHNVPVNPLGAMMQTPRDTAIFAVVVMIAGGIREEVQRGFILHRFAGYLGGGAAGVVIYSLAFGLGHLTQGYDAALATAVLGAVWGIAYLARRSVVAPMVCHSAFNLIQLLKFAVLR